MDFYVYIHRRKTTGEVFYVGKGKGNRAWKNADRSDYWKKVSKKYGHIVEIVLDNLQEWYAFELEKDLISYYGRENIGEGTLVNLTDGGEGASGSILSEECKQKMRESRKGKLHPKYKPDLLYFYNLDTGAIVSDTRLGFSSSFPDVSVRALAVGLQKSSKRWVILDVITEKEIEALTSGIFKGENNGNCDTKIYKLKNVKTNEDFEGTRFDFTEKFGLKLNILFNNTSSTVTVGGWCFLDKFEEAKSISFHKTHRFQHLDGQTFFGTHKDFILRYGISLGNLFRKKRPAKISQGWRLVTS